MAVLTEKGTKQRFAFRCSARVALRLCWVVEFVSLLLFSRHPFVYKVGHRAGETLDMAQKAHFHVLVFF